MSAVVTVGRGQQADVQLTEEHVSRKHFQLTLTQDGWVFENLSPLKSRVNGKKYKVGKKIILDTGDVIGIGAETELLFVASGDDPEAAVIAYRQSGARKGQPRAAAAPAAPTVEPSADEQASEPGQQKDGSGKAAKPAVQLEEEEEEELTDEELAAQAQRAKFKKYATIFGAYMGLLGVVVVILLSMGRRAPIVGPDGRAELLDKQRIDDLINTPFTRERNAVAAREALEKAILALERTNKVDHQYRAVYWFKVAKAYGRVLSSSEEKESISVRRQLTKRVQDMYRNAYAFQKDHQYITSERIYRELLEMLPTVERRDKIRELRQNIIAHVSFIRRVSAGDNRR